MLDAGRVGPFGGPVRGAVAEEGPEVALVVLSKVEQRLDAVRAVFCGAPVSEVAAAVETRGSRCMAGWWGICWRASAAWRTGRIDLHQKRLNSAVRASRQARAALNSSPSLAHVFDGFAHGDSRVSGIGVCS
jgi:hypothetical protein